MLNTPVRTTGTEILEDPVLLNLNEELRMSFGQIVSIVNHIEGKRDERWKQELSKASSNCEQIESLAVEHEAFGFGQVDAKGFTTHGFDADGLQAFIKELFAVKDICI